MRGEDIIFKGLEMHRLRKIRIGHPEDVATSARYRFLNLFPADGGRLSTPLLAQIDFHLAEIEMSNNTESLIRLVSFIADYADVLDVEKEEIMSQGGAK